MAGKFAADQGSVRAFAVEHAETGTRNLAQAIQNEFGVSRPTAHNYLRSLVDDGVIERVSAGIYRLVHTEKTFTLRSEGSQEDRVWRAEILPMLDDLPGNVIDIWHYGCTEMINNAIDHSESEFVGVKVDRTAASTRVQIYDHGIGIFRKIARGLGLEDDRHAVLELTKGKVTTDPENHSGEGIFFTSRIFDEYTISSGDVFFKHDTIDDYDWILGEGQEPENVRGTLVSMRLRNDSTKSLREVFDKYASEEGGYRFDRTVVPVKLLAYGDELLISRSQAKRLLRRFERFGVVILDFEGVDDVGQAFADEIFRVFARKHPGTEIVPINANEAVSRMITRAQNAARS